MHLLRRWWARAMTVGIPARSAFAAASVVLVAAVIGGAGLLGVLYRSMVANVDDAAASRAADVVAALRHSAPTQLADSLLAVDQRIVAVQIVNPSGQIARASLGAPTSAMATHASSTLRRGLDDQAAGDHDVRVSTQSVSSAGGTYTVAVGAGSESVESTLIIVAGLLAVGTPIIVAVSALTTYLLVSRSLRSVEAIRTRVADISTSDLTERVPVPNQRDEISALATTMNQMLTRIEDGHNAQRRFVSDASHELRSPLASVISALDVGVAHPEAFDTAVIEQTLLPEAHRMQRLIDDLLLLAKADEQGISLHRADVDLDDIGTAAAGRLRSESTLTVTTNIRPVRVTGDGAALTRLLRNLVDNAVRHARLTVEIVVAQDDTGGILTVADDGPGIAPRDRQRVLERFVRLDEGRARGDGGSGLGLAIVDEIATAHGGSVDIGERKGGGAAVTVRLPASGRLAD